MPGPLTRAGRLLRWFVRPFASQEPSFYRAVTACLLASGVFWQMNALNKTYTTELRYPLSWRYDEQRYVPLNPLPATVPVTVTGQGWRLLRCNLGLAARPAELQPQRLPGEVSVAGLPLRQSLEQAFENMQIKLVSAPVVMAMFDRRATRSLPLVLAASDSIRPYTVQFTPAELTFTGPASVLARLPATFPVELPTALAGSSTGDVQVPLHGPAGVQLSASQVRARLRPRAEDLVADSTVASDTNRL